ncbi:MAG: four helix bundle protein [Proteobacteria bacterium HN_bin10]|nr:MAG: four helix bundle protein [Proteobacteria bacterium HN_bin10]
MQDFRKLRVWEKSHHLTLAIYRATATFPKDEQFGLVSQIRRAAVSVSANLAEGCGRSGRLELARFVQIAMGSASELQYHLLLVHDLRLVGPQDYKKLSAQVTEVKQMLAALVRKLRTDD